MLKRSLLLLCAAVTLSACAGVKVSKTYVATGATHPRSIYIRPFSVTQADFRGHQGSSPGELELRRSLAPAEFADALQEELAKIAPAQVLKSNEVPRAGSGWLVTGELQVVDAGSPTKRLFLGQFGAGRSHVVIHVRVIDVGRHHARGYVGKNDVADDTLSPRSTRLGDVIYEFDVAGGSHLSGKLGSIYAPGAGYATPFDFRNAAERIMIVLTPDPYRYGARTSPTTY